MGESNVSFTRVVDAIDRLWLDSVHGKNLVGSLDCQAKQLACTNLERNRITDAYGAFDYEDCQAVNSGLRGKVSTPANVFRLIVSSVGLVFKIALFPFIWATDKIASLSKNREKSSADLVTGGGSTAFAPDYKKSGSESEINAVVDVLEQHRRSIEQFVRGGDTSAFTQLFEACASKQAETSLKEIGCAMGPAGVENKVRSVTVNGNDATIVYERRIAGYSSHFSSTLNFIPSQTYPHQMQLRRQPDGQWRIADIQAQSTLRF